MIKLTAHYDTKLQNADHSLHVLFYQESTTLIAYSCIQLFAGLLVSQCQTRLLVIASEHRVDKHLWQREYPLYCPCRLPCFPGCVSGPSLGESPETGAGWPQEVFASLLQLQPDVRQVYTVALYGCCKRHHKPSQPSGLCECSPREIRSHLRQRTRRPPASLECFSTCIGA